MIQTDNEDIRENHDHYQYNWVMFYRDTIEFFIHAVKFYEDLLSKEASILNEDFHLNNFLTNDLRREFRIGRNLEEATRVREWLENHSNKSPDRYDIDISLSHGNVRYLKSVGILYLGFIKQHRNALSENPNMTSNLLSAIDRQISHQEENINQLGVFKNASLIPLIVDQNTIASAKKLDGKNDVVSIAKATRPKPQIISTIEILDSELRERCLDLFNQFNETGQSERHDTVVAEAARILENRLRLLTKSDDGATGIKLLNRAFDKANPLIKVSTVSAEQEGAELLFRGLFGFIRNQFQHKLVSDISSERVLQILGFVDYLISIINSTIPNSQIEIEKVNL